LYAAKKTEFNILLDKITTVKKANNDI